MYNSFKLNPSERDLLDCLMLKAKTFSDKPMQIIDCRNMSEREYRFELQYHRYKVIIINPIYVLSNRINHNDLAIYHPELKYSYAFECKFRSTSTLQPNHLNKELHARQNVLENKMFFYLDGNDGNYSQINKYTLSTITKNIIFSLNDLNLT